MKRVSLLLFLAMCLGPVASAQDQFQVGAYGDYFRVTQTKTNLAGLGLYPAVGVEGHLGPIGIRLEAGDEIYYAGGTHHNPRAAFGPFIRF